MSRSKPFLTAGVLVAVLLFSVTAPPRHASAQAGCDRRAARKHLAAAESAVSHGSFAAAERHALHAAATFASCAGPALTPQSAPDAFARASALLIGGASQLRERRKAEADATLHTAYALFDALQRDPQTPATLSSRSLELMGKLVGLDPAAKFGPPLAVLPTPAATEALPLEIHPINGWRTILNDPNGGPTQAFLHIRVHVAASAPATLQSSAFRVTAFSAVAGQETISGLAQPVPNIAKTNYATNPPSRTWVPIIAREDDLGAMGMMRVDAGDQKTFIVTFPIRAEEASSDEQLASVLSTLTVRQR